jgi:malto-oligosyltrehalose trehalohydrolase
LQERYDERFGPRLAPDGVTFRLWAPAAARVDVLLDAPHAMARRDEGWFEARIPGAGPGTRYRFRIDDELDIPDPASRFQPQDVNGPSEVVDPSFHWGEAAWCGRPWHEAVIYELHVGAFTAAGTFRAAVEKLDHLVETGVTAVELMPVADFAGNRNWGYDGVLLFAPDSVYGRPEDLKALIDAAHQRGLMVFLDVVYNHFGPDGNYLGRYAPQFFTTRHTTPWGAAIDYSVPQVRRFAVENALYWLREYRFDGLRLDAVHAIVEPGSPHILTELSRAVGAYAANERRHIHLVLENDNNQASFLDPLSDPAHGQYRAQWNDDYHHAWHVTLTGEKQGYYRDYARAKDHLVRVLSSGFAYQGERSQHRSGAPRGEVSGNLPPIAFVNFIQNHDQIGNRPMGDRLAAQANAHALDAALAVTLLAPMPPLLFMGEEWGSTRPFPFFCDFSGDLAEAVRRGRRSEFAEAYEKFGEDIPDPLEKSTFDSAVLDWDSCQSGEHSQRLDFVRRLLATRYNEIIPRLAKLGPFEAQAQFSGDVLRASWRLADASQLHMLANLSGTEAVRPRDLADTRPIWGGAPPPQLPAWSVYCGIGGP